jgi:MFS family permease
MERVGAFGNYQVGMLMILLVINYLSGGLILISPYIFHQDSYSCPNL